MLTQLATIRSRLGIQDLVDDALLISFGKWVSTRFDQICNRTFARTAGLTWEFDADIKELRPASFPIETVTGFDLKTTEVLGWVPQTMPDYLLRRGTVIVLGTPLGTSGQLARVTYAGGYVLPGTTPTTGQTALPDAIEQACIEQVAYLYQNRNRLGLTSVSGEGGSIQQFAQIDLLPSVKATLKKYERFDP